MTSRGSCREVGEPPTLLIDAERDDRILPSVPVAGVEEVTVVAEGNVSPAPPRAVGGYALDLSQHAVVVAVDKDLRSKFADDVGKLVVLTEDDMPGTGALGECDLIGIKGDRRRIGVDAEVEDLIQSQVGSKELRAVRREVDRVGVSLASSARPTP